MEKELIGHKQRWADLYEPDGDNRKFVYTVSFPTAKPIAGRAT